MTGGTKPTLGGALFAVPSTEEAVAEAGELGDLEGNELLDPQTSARRYWRDPLTGTQREIWRPGDGDGDVEHDHFERRGPMAPIDKRWRLYQLPGPFKLRLNEPPSNVILDDRAVHEILASNIPRAQLPKRWSHDFSGLSAVRHRRTHRGRPAYKDPNASTESERYHSFKPNGKNAPLYLFSGEKDFTPVFYSELPDAPEIPELPDSPKKPKQHNQYTAPDQLVRNGAQSASLTKGKYRPRVNTFLRRSPSPPWVKDRKRLFGGVGIGRTAPTASRDVPPVPRFDFSFASAPAPAPVGAPEEHESMWVGQDEDQKVEMDIDDDDQEVLPSIFEAHAAIQLSGRAYHDSGSLGHAQQHERQTSLFFAQPRAPKEMGYIERLAAGLSEEDVHAAATEDFALNFDTTNGSGEDRVALLESELQVTKDALDAKDQEIRDLKSQLEEMRTQMDLQQGVQG